jgi:hypothetical protein
MQSTPCSFLIIDKLLIISLSIEHLKKGYTDGKIGVE